MKPENPQVVWCSCLVFQRVLARRKLYDSLPGVDKPTGLLSDKHMLLTG